MSIETTYVGNPQAGLNGRGMGAASRPITTAAARHGMRTETAPSVPFVPSTAIKMNCITSILLFSFTIIVMTQTCLATPM